MDSDKGSSPPCGIYLHITDVTDKLTVLKNLRQVAMVINRSSDYERNMHMVMFDYDPLQILSLRELIEAVRMGGIVAIVNGGATGFESTGADGVVAHSMKEVAALRSQIGVDAIIGLDMRGDLAVLKDSGADFVVLPADVMKISAWAMMTEILCVVRGRIDVETCGDYAAAGASFVDVSDYALKHEKGVMQGIVNILDALARALRQRLYINH